MEKIKTVSNVSVNVNIQLNLTEGEARALEAICGYGPDAFVEWFYKNCGKHYLQPHETAMRSLFKTVKNELPSQLRRVDELRKFLIQYK